MKTFAILAQMEQEPRFYVEAKDMDDLVRIMNEPVRNGKPYRVFPGWCPVEIKNMTTAEITDYIKNKIALHFANSNETFIDILSGDIQKGLNLKDVTPQVCNGMRNVAEIYPHQTIFTPNKGMGTTLKIRYYRDDATASSAEKIETVVGQPKNIVIEYKSIIDKEKNIEKIESETLKNTIFDFYNEIIKDTNGRFKSWEHCHKFFKENRRFRDDESHLDMMCLHLAFYLASWGMLRGSSFLLEKDYLVHRPSVIIMLEDRYENLWRGDPELLINNIDLILECKERIAESYKNQMNCKEPSPILLTKILLGVYGCTPAYDRFFTAGLRNHHLTANFGKRSLYEVFQFYMTNRDAFEVCKEMIEQHGMEYTPMKLTDMFFWEMGVKLSNKTHEEALEDRED